jgi:hypothetical protein
MKQLLLLLALVSLSFALSPASFRLQSTAGIWEDDYDLIFDPGRLPLIDGQRVYTNLSNYVTSNEAMFGLNSSNFILLGASGHLGNRLAPAAVFDAHNFQTPQFTGLFGANSSDSLFGSGRVNDVSWLDLDSNGVYDYKRVRETGRNAWSSGSGNDLFVAAGWKTGANRFGLALAYNDSATKQVLPALDYVEHDYDSSLIAGGLAYLLDDTSRYFDQSRATSAGLVLSNWRDLKGGSMLGISLSPAYLADNALLDRTQTSHTDYAPSDTAVSDFARGSIDDIYRLPYTGFQIPVNVTLVRPKGEKTQSWFYAQGFFRTQSLAKDAGSHDLTQFSQTLNPGDSSVIDNLVHVLGGMRTSFGGSLRLKELYQMGERLDFGWSAQLGARWYSDSLSDKMAEVGWARHDDGDSIQSHSDYTQTITGTEHWMNRLTGREASLVVPVGLEFKLVPSLALRLGAQHTVVWDDHISTRQLLTWAPRKTRTDYGDGTFYETIDTLTRQTASSETRNSFSQATLFSYGAGFRPMENLQIDLMGFANLVNLTAWRLSATLRF